MKRRIVIHAGLPKCGSTALQIRMASNRDLLRRSGVVYPRTITIDAETPVVSEEGTSFAGRNNGHQALAQDMVRATARQTRSAMLAQVVDDFRATDARALVLSSESFIVRASRISTVAIGDLLADFDVCIVLFLRQHDRWMHSMYKQCVKGPTRRYAGTFTDFITAPPPFAATFSGVELTASLAALRRAFGTPAITSFALDEKGSDSIRLFGDLIGAPLAEMSNDPGNFNRYNSTLHACGLPINQSIGDGGTAFLAELLRRSDGAPALSAPELGDVAGAIATNGDLFPEISFLTPALSRSLLFSALQDRHRLERRFGIAFRPPQPVRPNAGTVYADRLSDAQWRAAAAALLPRLAPVLQEKVAPLMGLESLTPR